MIAINTGEKFEHLKDSPPLFLPGDLVKHRAYGYRGVIVAVDGHCKADPEWYMSNKTQPDREQPWYHVIVHGTETCTYACLLYTSPSPRDQRGSRMPSSA